MACTVSTYSFIERLTQCGLYGFSSAQLLLLAGLILLGVGYAIWEHRTQLRKEKGEQSDRM